MAEKVTAKTTKTETTKKIDIDNLNLDAKITVINLAGWGVGFERLHDGTGAVSIAPNGKQRLSRNEVQAQINNNNKLCTGTDGRGSHATIFIDDEATRLLVGFDDEDGTRQRIYSDKVAKKLFEMNFDLFENAVYEYIQTRAEKNALMESIRRLGLNDYRKIVFVENFTGYKL